MQRQAPGPGRFVLLAALLWVLAILAVRLLLTGGWGWGVFALLSPVLLVLLRLATNWPVALLLLAFFVATVLAFRYVLADPRIGWSAILLSLLGFVALWIGARVALTMWREHRMARDPKTRAEPK